MIKLIQDYDVKCLKFKTKKKKLNVAANALSSKISRTASLKFTRKTASLKLIRK